MGKLRESDAIIFDLFGTLVEFRMSWMHDLLHAMAANLEIPFHEFLERWSSGYAVAEVSATRTADHRLREIVDAVGVQPDPDQIPRWRAAWRRFRHDLLNSCQGALETLRDLRDRGLKLGLLSNCPSDVPILWQQSVLAPLFDVTGFSCEMAVCKPDRQSYHLVCQRLAVPPHRALFVGDGGSHELSGAAVAGLRPIQLRPAAGADDPDLRREQWPGPTIGHLRELIPLLSGE